MNSHGNRRNNASANRNIPMPLYATTGIMPTKARMDAMNRGENPFQLGNPPQPMNLYGPIGTRVSGRGLGRGKHGTTQPGMPSGPQSGNPLGGRPNGLQQSPQPRMPLGLQQPGRLWRNPAIQQQMQNQLGQPPPAMQGMMPNPSPMGQRGMPFGGTATSNPNWANGSGQHPRAGVAPTRRERFQPAAGAGRRQSDVGREGDVIGRKSSSRKPRRKASPTRHNHESGEESETDEREGRAAR